MVQCVAFGCSNRQESKIPGVTFHRFPVDPEIRKQWENALKRANFKATNHTAICSVHFKEEDFDKSSPFVTKVKKGVVPSVFPGIPENKNKIQKEMLGDSTYIVEVRNSWSNVAKKVDNRFSTKSKNTLRLSAVRKKPGPKRKSKQNMPGGTRCSVAICTSHSTAAKAAGQVLKFFAFPKDENIKKQWIVRCFRKDKWNPDTGKICSLHFTKDDYEDALKADLLNIPSKKLKSTAVPSLNLTLDPNDQHLLSKPHRKIYNPSESESLYVNDSDSTSSNVTPISPKEELLKEFLSVVSNPVDSIQPFIDFVANEIHGIRHEELRKKLKLLILKDIISITEEDQSLSQIDMSCLSNFRN